MKITINESMFIQQFRLYGRSDEFSSNALRALYKHLEEVYGEDGEYEYALDVVSLCCIFTEFDTALDAAKNYSSFINYQDLNEEKQERLAHQFLSKSCLLYTSDAADE